MLQIQVPAVRRSGGYSDAADDSDTGRCRATGKVQKAVEATQVQFKKMNQQWMQNIKKVPDIAKTDETPQVQFMPRRCTTNSCGDTVPNAQEIQIGMPQRSAVRERSGGYARCEGQARAIQTRRMQQSGC